MYRIQVGRVLCDAGQYKYGKTPMNADRTTTAVRLQPVEAEGPGRGPAIAGGGATIRDQLLLAAVRQGPSFVVLLLVLFGVWKISDYVVTQGVASGIEQIKAGYREIQKSHDANLRELVAAFERDEERDRAVVDLVREVVENRELLKESHAILRALEQRTKDK